MGRLQILFATAPFNRGVTMADLISTFRPDKTIAAFNKIIDDFKKACTVTDIVLQFVFIAFYIFSILTKFNVILLVVINSVLLAISIVALVFTFIALSSKDENFKNTVKKRADTVFKYIKLATRVITIGFSIYEIAVFDHSFVKIIVTALTIVCFALQLLLEVVKYVLTKYITLVKLAITMDVEEISDSTVVKAIKAVKSPVKTVVDLLNKPFDATAVTSDDSATQTEQASEVDPKERKRREMLNKLAEENAAAAQAKKKQTEEEQKRQARVELSNSLNTLKKNIKSLFKRKDKTQTETDEGEEN